MRQSLSVRWIVLFLWEYLWKISRNELVRILLVDLCKAKQCPANSECVVDAGMARCVCQDGFVGQPGNCRPGRCQLIKCGEHSTCLPAVDGGVACLCEAGFRLITTSTGGATCVDINECAENPNLCGHGQCQNTIGSYVCKCDVGFNFNSVTCEGKCPLKMQTLEIK